MAISDNIYSYYKLDGNSNDAVGSKNGTDTGITYNASYGILGQGATFSAAPGKIVLPTALNLGTAWSAQAWINISAVPTYGYILSIRSGNTTFMLGSQNYGGKVGLNDWGATATDIRTVSSVPSGWHHFVVTSSGATQATLYMDGSAQNSSNAFGFVSQSLGNAIGNREDGAASQWAGYIDEVGFWTRALSSGEVSSLYNGGAGLAYPFSGGATVNSNFLRFI